MTRVRECGVCAAAFTEASNMGRWECRWHPGRVDESARVWSCCERPRFAPGCRRADHSEARRHNRAPLVALVPAFVELRPPPLAVASVAAEDVAGGWIVMRVRAAADSRGDASNAQEAMYTQWERHNHRLVLRCDAYTFPRMPV
jgi:hypothetical protein